MVDNDGYQRLKRFISPRMALEAEPPPVWLLRRPEFLYSAGLFAAAVAALGLAAEKTGSLATAAQPGASLFFLCYGLLTITTGYHHPRVGHVSFDRVSQVASILVLGPIEAALVNGVASFVYPWHRLWKGQKPGQVITASLNNAGLMTLMILSCGLLYQELGGQIPLLALDWRAAALLPLLIVTMQVVNEIGMGFHLLLRDGEWAKYLNGFVLALESSAGMAAVVLAIVFNRMELPVLIVLLVLVTTVMMVVTQFARMRLELETIIDDRTRVLREKTVELEQLATRDQLTGLFNRRFVDQYLDGRIEEFTRYGRRFAVALIDLDHFKRINDQQSHEVGDEVLKGVGRMFVERCRDTDVVSRYGGEEFLLCFPEASAAEVAEICEQLRQALEVASWDALAEGVSVSLSAGVAEMRPGHSRSSLVNAADRKLYQAKRAGRNRVIC